MDCHNRWWHIPDIMSTGGKVHFCTQPMEKKIFKHRMKF